MTQQIDIWQTDFLLKQKSEPFLREILADYLNIPANELAIEKNAFGKPFLCDFPDWHFNLSHSGEKLLLAISYKNPIGIDIEFIKNRSSINDVVKRCFSELEQKYWFDLPETEKLTAFYDFWTRKEAVVKGIGRGIALGLNQCEIDINQPNQFLKLPVNETWHTYSVQIAPNYCAVVATQFDDVSIKISEKKHD
jgi:4'-phosphopantetheinyl transferase